ncbi:MAG: FAD-binding oxidoreductase [Alphaproteobacteria bacterium]
MTTPTPVSCRVTGLTDLTPEIRKVLVSPRTAGFRHRPGQFARVTFKGIPPRDYSLANAPAENANDAPVYEFHIRRERGGLATRHVFADLQPGDPVDVSGPYGTGYLREKHTGPIVAIGGGSGLAPMIAIVDAVLRSDPDRPVHLYIGARDEPDLYLLDRFDKLQARHRGFRYTPVLSDPARPTDRRTGFVHEAVLDDDPDLVDVKIYMAGPPVMVENARGAFLSTGIAEDDLHHDTLPPAP